MEGSTISYHIRQQSLVEEYSYSSAQHQEHQEEEEEHQEQHIFARGRSNEEDMDAVRISGDEALGGLGCFEHEEDEDGSVSGHVIGLHDYRLDETADWYDAVLVIPIDV